MSRTAMVESVTLDGYPTSPCPTAQSQQQPRQSASRLIRCQARVSTEVVADALPVAAVAGQAGRILGAQVFRLTHPDGWLCRPADAG